AGGSLRAVRQGRPGPARDADERAGANGERVCAVDADRVDKRRPQEHERNQRAALSQPATDQRALVEVSGSRGRHVRQAAAHRREARLWRRRVQRTGGHAPELHPPRRLRASPHRERLFRRRRRRLRLLLDDGSAQGRRQALKKTWRRASALRSSYLGAPGSGWITAFDSAPLNSVVSPAFFPGAGNSRAASGFFHLKARVATSPIMRAIVSSLVSPGSGTVSTPPAQTAEKARIESSPQVL